jgi:precorrin-2 dehydrogenase/sirohydrochlorin ferrochelatase
MDLDVTAMRPYYPAMLDVSSKICLVVGGGKVAERKVASLLEAGALVTVVSLEVSLGLEEKASRGEITMRKRAYKASDLQGFSLVIAATDQPEVNEAVSREAARLGVWVNVVDRPDLSSFIVPSVIRRGKLILAVSTGGASPSTARRIAGELEASYGAEYEIYLDFLSVLRLKVQSRVKDKEIRQRLFKKMLDWDILGRIREGTFDSWKVEVETALEQDPTLQGAFFRDELEG